MKRLPSRLPTAALVVLFVGCFCASAPILRAADLASDISAALRDKALAKGEAGVEILRLEGTRDGKPQVLFRHNSDIPLIPASNLKLLTTSAFLDHFGADFKFKTTLANRGEDLILVGDGDPSFGDAELYKKLGWESTTVFANWAEMLKKRGITSVNNVLVDDTILDQEFVHARWPANQQHLRYVAGVAGMNFNANALDFYLHVSGSGSVVNYETDPPATKYANVNNACVGGRDNAVWLSRTPNTNNVELKGETNADNAKPISVSVHDPSLYAATVLRETLESKGIKVTGKVDRDSTARTALKASASDVRVMAIHETPLDAVLARANKDSMNLYAEAMCKRLGADVSGQPGSWKNGTAALADFLGKCGVSASESNLDDGCGLSKENKVSANALARVLAYNFASTKVRQTFTNSLAVAGADGTLDKRFKDAGFTDLRGRVFAKSGFVNGVSSLSGYVKAKDDRWYAFSILMNGVGDIATCKQIQEKIVRAIDDASSVGVSSAR